MDVLLFAASRHASLLQTREGISVSRTGKLCASHCLMQSSMWYVLTDDETSDAAIEVPYEVNDSH